MFIAFIATVVGFVIPEIVDSISSLILALPMYSEKITAFAITTLDNNEGLRDLLINQTDTIISYLEDIMTKAGPLISSFASGFTRTKSTTIAIAYITAVKTNISP